MGFDKHFYEDHCYLDDPTNNVGMNVEIIEDNSQGTNAVEYPLVRYSNGILNNQSDMSWEPTKKAETHLYVDYCTEHSDMFLFEDAELVKPGDKFASHDDFVQYVNDHAKRWCYYYKCSDSRKPNTESETYTYNCVYLRSKEKYKKKGLRKRSTNVKTDCPCKIKLRHLPKEKELTVVYVCNHHDHELSVEQFYKLQHGRRIPPYVKEEILDFLALQVDKDKIQKYVEMETGLNMSHKFFYALERNLLKKANNIERYITQDRLKMLNEKIPVLQLDDNPEPTEEYIEQTETPRTSNPRRVIKAEHISQYVQSKRRSQTEEDELESPKITKMELCSEVNFETINTESIQDSIKCEIQKNPWISDQCVPVLPNRTEVVNNSHDLQIEEATHFKTENCSYKTTTVYNPETQEIYEITEPIHGTPHDSNEDIENIANETEVTEENEATHNALKDYVNGEQIIIYSDNPQEVINNVNNEFANQENIIEVDHVQYINDNEELVEYINGINGEEHAAHDIGVQTNKTRDEHTLLPVFDVYMKDGNVTGFVLNDNVINTMKYGVDKGIQTSEDIIYSDLQEIENEDSEIFLEASDQTGDTYTKHEYVHKYNIDQYMTQPNFPKYIEILGKETYTDVLNMLTNVYNEKAMFKLTTTQKGNEGNTRICYVTHNGKIKKKKTDDAKREKLGKNLHSVFVLKEKLRMFKKQNDALLKRNKYLEDVALRFVKLS